MTIREVYQSAPSLLQHEQHAKILNFLASVVGECDQVVDSASLSVFGSIQISSS